MQSSSYLQGSGGCCDQMRAAYMQFEANSADFLSPYAMFFRPLTESIMDVTDFNIVNTKTLESYCWTSVDDFTLPKPRNVDFQYACGEKTRNRDFNTIKCKNIKYRGWIRGIDVEKPFSLCESSTMANFHNRSRQKAGVGFFEEIRDQFLRGAFQPVQVDCVTKEIKDFADLVIDASASGITVESFREIQTLYGFKYGEFMENIMVFLTTTGYNQLMADLKTNYPNCCTMQDTSALTYQNMMREPVTGIKYTVVPDEMMDKHSGNKQWMIALNSKYCQAIMGSSYFNAGLFNNFFRGYESVSGQAFSDIRGVAGMFNVVESVSLNPTGKMPGAYMSYWMLNSFIKADPLGVILIKGKV